MCSVPRVSPLLMNGAIIRTLMRRQRLAHTQVPQPERRIDEGPCGKRYIASRRRAPDRRASPLRTCRRVDHTEVGGSGTYTCTKRPPPKGSLSRGTWDICEAEDRSARRRRSRVDEGRAFNTFLSGAFRKLTLRNGLPFVKSLGWALYGGVAPRGLGGVKPKSSKMGTIFA